MKSTYPGSSSLSGRMFTSILLFTLVLMLVLSTAMTTIYFLSHKSDAEADLMIDAREVAACLNAADPADRGFILSEQLAGPERYTLIDADGTVLYDSKADYASMENHATRPEVQEAARTGEGIATRHSMTLSEDLLYAAIMLDDGDILRLSETSKSLMSFLHDTILPFAIALAIAIVLVLMLSKKLTQHIMRPIDALDLSNPLDNEIYDEMSPLLVRIDEQQRQLKQQNRELIEAKNMRRDFSSNVSHEMKTPLQVISGYAELMKDGIVQPADSQKVAGLIYSEAQAMRALIDDLLTLSKLDESAFGAATETVDLLAVARRVAERLHGTASAKGVEVSVEGGDAIVRGNAILLEEMIYNLVDNGIRYDQEGGRVSISMQREQENQVESLVVRVADTGPGIPPELRERVFERFFRVDGSRSKETGGTGLGLAIVKHAVMYHNGTIEIEEAPDGGSVFVLRFPVES